MHGQLRSGEQGRGDEERRRRGEVAGDLDVSELEPLDRLNADAPRLAADRHAGLRQHVLGVVARRQRLLDGRLAALRVEPGEQNRRLDLRARDRKLVRDRLATTSPRSRSAHGPPPSRSKRPSGGEAPRRAPSDASCSDSSPVSSKRPCWPTRIPGRSRISVPALPQSIGLVRRDEPAEAAAEDAQRVRVGLVDPDPERADRRDRRLRVVRATEAGDAGLAVGDRPRAPPGAETCPGDAECP